MRAYGAEVILTSADRGIEGSRDIAFNMRDKEGYTLLNQFAHLPTGCSVARYPKIENATRATISSPSASV